MTAVSGGRAPRTGGPAGKGRLRQRLFRYGVASVVATMVSQVTLVAVYAVHLLGARDAAIVATMAGAVPSYHLNRRWAWSRTGRSHAVREVVPYLVSTLVGLFASIWAVDAADSHLRAAGLGHAWRTVGVWAAYVGAYGVLWIGKFVLFDRVVFGSGAVPARGHEPAAAPVVASELGEARDHRGGDRR